MSATVYVTVEDVAEQIDAGYTEVQLHRADSVAGSYSEVDSATLDEDTYSYELEDSTGDLTKWYKYRLSDGSSTHSDFSNPFQLDGLTRKKIRQEAIKRYKSGMVLSSTSGGSTTSILTTDHRIKGAGRTDRYKGNWILITTGAQVGTIRQVTASNPSTGALTVAAMGGALTSGDEFELYRQGEPDDWNDALNRGMRRYHYLERVPIVGVAGQSEYDLTDLFPWILLEDQIKGLWHYPDPNSGNDAPYVGDGLWWHPRTDTDRITLAISPPTTATLYLEATRTMPQLHTDASVAPINCDLDFIVALTYDELLGYLSRPGNGASQDRRAWRETRIEHASQELVGLLRKHRVKYRSAPPVDIVPPQVPRPFSAR